MGALKALLFTVVSTGLIMWLGLYLQSRKPSAEPTRFERIVANLYLLFRRIVCFTAAFIILLAGALFVRAAPNLWLGLFACVVTLIPVALLVWLGWFGHERDQGSWNNDITRYEAHRKRYRWRW